MKAYEAVQYALAAKDDTTEFLRRMELVPEWVSVEVPESRRMIWEALPRALRMLKKLAAAGNKDAAALLYDSLERNPDWQSLFEKDDSERGES